MMGRKPLSLKRAMRSGKQRRRAKRKDKAHTVEVKAARRRKRR